MRVGILTYQNALNVGAVLQANALQRVITQMGYNCDIIDYRSTYLEEIYKYKKITQVNSLKGLIKWLLNANKEKRKRIKFDKFNLQYQKLSKTVYFKQNIEDANKEYNIFIVGSDQVWNMNLNGKDTTYLLDFAQNNKTKISYAASFGYKKIPGEYLDITHNGISRIDAISVRETSGSSIVGKMVGKEPQVVLDPTLLLKKDEWDLTSIKRLHEKEYILVYIIAATPTILEFSKKLGKEHNCDVICIHNSYAPKSGVKNVRDCSPIEFLSYIKHAKFVVSSSFHGICFSILFEKEFFFELDEKPENNNSRIETLIENLGLWKRQIVGGNCVMDDKIDYERVTDKLNSEREKSYEFLKESMEDSKYIKESGND